MKIHIKLQITPLLYHLIPYKYIGKVNGINITEFGFLCFKIIKTN